MKALNILTWGSPCNALKALPQVTAVDGLTVAGVSWRARSRIGDRPAHC